MWCAQYLSLIFGFCCPKDVISMRLVCKELNQLFVKNKQLIHNDFKNMSKCLCNNIIDYNKHPASLNWLRYYWELRRLLWMYGDGKMSLPVSITRYELSHGLLILIICSADLLLLFKTVFKDKYNNNPNIKLKCSVSGIEVDTLLSYQGFRENSQILRYILDESWKDVNCDTDVNINTNKVIKHEKIIKMNGWKKALATAVKKDYYQNAAMILNNELIAVITKNNSYFKCKVVNYWWQYGGGTLIHCPLAIACHKKNSKIIQLLINNGADLENTITFSGYQFDQATIKQARMFMANYKKIQAINR